MAFRLLGPPLAAVLILFILFIPQTTSAATISVMPGSQLAVTAGNNATVDLNISGLGAGTFPSLGVYDLNVTFNPALLSFVNVNWGTGLDIFGLGSLRTVNTSSGLVNIFELSLDSAADLNALQTANLLLASLQFIGVGTGTSNIALAINALGDADGASLSANIVYGSGTGVPEPSSGVLLLIGGGVLLARRYRR